MSKGSVKKDTELVDERAFKCQKEHVVRVLASGAGYYLGSLDPEDGCPYCRINHGYYKGKADAQKHLNNLDFMPRHCMENEFCNEGKGCQLRMVEDDKVEE